jgi:hypothetical protein
MKSRCQRLVEKSISAMLSAIEIYSKPDFKYREETFSILAINSWELLLKAKWLKDNNNSIDCLYIKESKRKKDNTLSKRKSIKKTDYGVPFTHGLSYLLKSLRQNGSLDDVVYANIDALCAIRDSSVHFYNESLGFALRLQEIGSASVKNYVKIIETWFNEDLSNYNFYLIPLIHAYFDDDDIASINSEEKMLIDLFKKLEENIDENSDYSLSVGVDVRFVKSRAGAALKVKLSNDSDATKITLTEEDILARYPLTYDKLCERCKSRYSDFKVNDKFHKARKEVINNIKYCHTRKLDPSNPNDKGKVYYSEAIFTVFDKTYQKNL